MRNREEDLDRRMSTPVIYNSSLLGNGYINTFILGCDISRILIEFFPMWLTN